MTSGTNARVSRGGLVWALVLASTLPAAVPAFAQDTAPQATTAPAELTAPSYRDDRSTPEAVIESLYNAVNRREIARAWSYFRDEPDRPDFETFAKGYENTTKVRIRLGVSRSEGAAGTITYRVPAVVEATQAGTATVFSGCYELRLAQPAAQAEPPFQPMEIVRGSLRQSKARFEDGEGECSDPAP